MNVKPNSKKAITWLSLAHFTNDTYAGFLNPIMPFIAVKIGISMAIATVIMSIAQICASFFQPIFGFWADNMLKRAFIFWGLIFGTLFIPLAPGAHNVYILTLCVILGNLGGSFFHPQALGFVSKFAKEGNFVQTMAMFISVGTIGFAFGPIISSIMTQYMGLDKIPYTSFIGIILALFMFICVPKLSESGLKIQKHAFGKSFRDILTNKFMLILIVTAMMKALITNSCTILLPFLWKGLGYKPAYIGMALFLFLLLGGFGSLISGKLEAKIGAKPVLYISMIGTFPLMFLFVETYKTQPFLSLIIFVLMGFVTMLAQPVTMVMAQRLLPDYKSIVAGFINGFSWGVVAVALTIIGYLAQNFGIVKVIFCVSSIPVIFSYLVSYLPDYLNDVKS